MNIIYTSPVDYRSKVIHLPARADISIAQLKSCILRKEDLPECTEISLYTNGRPLDCRRIIDDENAFVHVSLPLKGGKGGFGSMLRAIGAQIEKTTNREACRDLSGRRLRDVNEEKRIKEWVKKQAEKKEEEEKKKKEKLKRLAQMTAPANCQYSDPEFEKTRAEIPDIVEDSINYGLQRAKEAASTSGKRKADDLDGDEEPLKPAAAASATETTVKRPSESKPIKKQALWLGVDIDSDDSDESESEGEKNEDDQPKKTTAAAASN